MNHTYRVTLKNADGMTGHLTVESWDRDDAKSLALEKLSAMGFTEITDVEQIG